VIQLQTDNLDSTTASVGNGQLIRPRPEARALSLLIRMFLYGLVFMLLEAGFTAAAEVDDASLFVEAFNAYQKNDYLLAIEKLGTINQLFPDTPLRDVALLLLARSGLKAGDNELAAKSISQFNSEFAGNPLKATAEDELLRLGIRWQKGERPPPAISLLTAARKTRDERLALERSTTGKTGQEHLLTEGSGQGRVTPEKAGGEGQGLERTFAGRISQEVVSAVINLRGTAQTSAVDQRGEIPFEVLNPGRSDESFALEASAPPGYDTTLTIAERSVEGRSQVNIGAGAQLKGSILYRTPPDKVDGYKATVSLQVISERDRHIVATRSTQVIAAAPLVRVVAKADNQRPAPGERMHYRITVLNAGSLAARELTVRVFLHPRLELAGEGTAPWVREAADRVAFKIDSLQSGKLVELTLDVKVREDSLPGQELRSRVEVVNSLLRTKETFTTAAVDVQGIGAPAIPVDRPR